MYNLEGNIFQIQRFSTSDGPGIRTVIFLKGCPLHCAWCHNPESQNSHVEIFYKKEMCVLCGECEKVCPLHKHTFSENIHHFSRQNCLFCTKCADSCPTAALSSCGEKKSVQEILKTVTRDKEFYEESGGGITLSGGEPLFQFDFSLALLRYAKECGLHTAMETSGFTQRNLTEINQYTDLWLYDLKVFPENQHIQYTGVSNKQILNNLSILNQLGANIFLRCPIIPDVNLNKVHFEKIAALAEKYAGIQAVHLEPYHPLGISKAVQLNKSQPYQNQQFLEKSVLKEYAEILRKKCNAEILIL